ncbi:MAG: Hsp70 family protein, partial [Myxococcota bacterium]
GDVQIDVNVAISSDGMVTVSAIDVETRIEQSISVEGPTALNEEEIQKMIADREKLAATDS